MFGVYAARARRATVSLLLVSLVASLLVLIPGGSARAQSTGSPYRPEFGAMFHVLWSDYNDAQSLDAVEKMADAGVEWLRIDVAWRSLQPDGPNSYSKWVADETEQWATEAHARGMKVLVMFWDTPSWAGRGSRSDHPKNVGDYARAADWISSRLADSVDAWEVWNEANLDGFYTGTPAQYVQLLKAAYPVFKENDPTAPVITAGTSYADVEWIEGIYKAGAQGFYDAIGVHPYMAPSDLPPETNNGEMWTISWVKEIRKLMNSYGDQNVPIWFTEFGWSTHENDYPSCKEVYNHAEDIDPNDGKGCQTNSYMGVTPKQQADYLVRTIDYITEKNEKAGWNVSHILWYNVRDKDSDNRHEDGFGLLYRNMSPKPAYYALKDYMAAATQPVEPKPSLVDEANLLANGDFEGQVDPWVAGRGKVKVSYDPVSGSTASMIQSKGKVRTLKSEAVSLEGRTLVEASGWVRVAKKGQRVKMILLETGEDNKVVARRAIRLIVQSTDWVRLPGVTYETSGGTSLRVKLKMRSRSHRYFFADAFNLVAR